MDPAPADRTERDVFAALPGLDAVSRRGLALALAGMPRAGIAGELGLGGAELSAAMAAGRKALRRTRAQLPSGGRCERAERALSDRLDGVPTPLDERFLTAHLARCSRCATHESELAAAVAQLRAGLASPPPRRAAPQPAVARAHLRAVPPPRLLPPAPAAAALQAAPAALQAAPAAPAAPTLIAEPLMAERPASRRNAALPVAIAVLAAAGLIAAAIALLMHFDKGDSHARAPWDRPNAPVVHPAPLSDQ